MVGLVGEPVGIRVLGSFHVQFLGLQIHFLQEQSAAKWGLRISLTGFLGRLELG